MTHPTSPSSVRQLTPLDRLVINLDHGIRTVFGKPLTTARPDPADAEPEADLGSAETKLSGDLMRVNHAGEVSAQALYQGQALTARLPKVRESMERAALEENDHLVWCERRCRQLGTHTSYLSPFWYLGSFTIGALAGAAGDKWSLGFVAETEYQVIAHLDNHLGRLPASDRKTRAILVQMKEDEAQHATTAVAGGAAQLPRPVKGVMSLVSRVMTGIAYKL